MTPWAWLIRKKKKEKKKKPSAGQSDQLHPSIWRLHGELLTLLLFLADLMRLDKPVGAWGAGISCSGSGIIPISLQSDAPNPTGQVHRGAGCPPPAPHCPYRDDSTDDDSKCFSRQKWSFECQMLKTWGPVMKTFSSSQPVKVTSDGEKLKV